ncbi:hypothetical protein KKH27_02115 [bacterium]|nr:hypothetical protein [bacterium]
MISRFYRHIALPIVDASRRTDSLSAFRELDRTQWRTTEELRQIQLDRLRTLLIHAAKQVPYYRDLFRECGFDPSALRCVEDLSVVPLLTKDIIRREASRLVADNARRFQPRPHRSAGTTGQPIVIQMDRRRHSVAWADMYRWWSAGGWRLGDRQFVVAGAALHPRQISGFKARLYSKLNHFVEYTSFGLSCDLLDRILDRLEKERQPIFLRGYASSIFELARRATDRNWQGSVKAIFTTAETLFPEQRRLIERALNGPVFDQWGCRDGGISAFECDHHRGLHLAVENTVVEICRNGAPLPPGESGDVVATDLFSFAMPIIRYEVGDVATTATELCPCGRGLPLIASVQGRVSGFLIGSRGRRIHGEFFSHVFWEASWVKHFQVVQDALDEIVVRIVLNRSPESVEVEAACRIMQEHAGPDCRIRLDFVDEIPPGPMGKRQFIICRIPTP